ncbi:Glutathione S-transferase GST-6.0 [Nymphon striatum]|nr:Glutathione S-transferase GST-6.0 [Nymphon striatum]
MLTLYYSKGSSALAAHILLFETGAVFEAEEVSIAKGQHLTPAFAALNPKQRIPILATPEGVITENPAILEYITEMNPGSGLLPDSLHGRAKARSLCAYLGATVHVNFAHLKRGARWADAPIAQASMAESVAENLAENARFLETCLERGPWALGATYSYCDPYLFLMGRWMQMAGMGLSSYPNLSGHADAMRARTATKAALAAHGLP